MRKRNCSPGYGCFNCPYRECGENGGTTAEELEMLRCGISTVAIKVKSPKQVVKLRRVNKK